MPHPTNLTTAQSLESILRSQSVTPATIAILDSKIHIGLSTSQLERLADPELSDAVKVSRRDIGACLAKGLVGGTTVAGTMVLGRSVGIGCFVTGGIGGVHRGAENSEF
jgi:pseudouridine-5'-phosphate glycosidase/pseudouridine kinase